MKMQLHDVQHMQCKWWPCWRKISRAMVCSSEIVRYCHCSKPVSMPVLSLTLKLYQLQPFSSTGAVLAS